MAVGPLLGGWLISAVSWRLIFFINLPVAAAVLVVSTRYVPESRNETAHGGVDVVGALLFCAGLGGTVYALTEGPSRGWSSPAVALALAGGLVALACFCWAELVRQAPLLPLSIFSSLRFSGTNAVTLVVYGGMGGVLFLLPIELEQVLNYSPVAAGVSLLPFTVMMLLLSGRSGALASRIGPRPQMTVGPVLVGAGLALLVRLGPGGNYWADVLPAVVVLGFGLAVTVAPLTATVLAAAPAEHSGVASAVNNDVARAGALIAVAVVPTVAGLTGQSYLHPHVLSAAFHRAVVMCAAGCALGGAIAWLTVGRRGPASPGAPAGVPAE